MKIFLDSMGGGAWPFLVGGVICLVNSVNERDLSLLISNAYLLSSLPLAEGSRQSLWVGLRFPKLGEFGDGFMDRISCGVPRCLHELYFLEGQSVRSRWKFEAITGL